MKTRLLAVILIAMVTTSSTNTVTVRVSPRANRVFTALGKSQEDLGGQLLPKCLRNGAITPTSARRLADGPEVEVLVLTDDIRALGDSGFTVRTAANRVAAVTLPLNRVHELEGLHGVRYVDIPKPLSALLDVSRREISADAVHSTYGLTGRSVVVGVLDTGIDWEHDDFTTVDGVRRVIEIWDQEDPLGPPPVGYTYGTKWTREEIKIGVPREVDEHGHGTHVAGIAAGNGRAAAAESLRYVYEGIAPEADIIAVKSTFYEGDIIDGAKWIQEEAGHRPCVINLSLGGQFGPHDGTSLLDLAMNGLSGPGRIIVAAAGNERDKEIHAEVVIGPGEAEIVDLVIDHYDANPGQSDDALLIDGAYEGSGHLLIQIITPSGISVGPIDQEDQQESVDTADGTVGLGQVLYPGNGDNLIECDVWEGPTGQPSTGVWRIQVMNAGTHPTELDAWIAFDALGSSGRAARWANFIDPEETVASPASADSVVAVGAYLTKTAWTSIGGTMCLYYYPPPPGDLATFSSLGPRRDGVEKPNVSAPGMGIGASKSRDARGQFADACRTTLDGYHVVAEGTSQACAHVTGVVALILEAHPLASWIEVMGRLKATARKGAFTGVEANNAFGCGRVDARAAVAYEQPASVLPREFEMRSHPNPFSSHTDISFNLDRAQNLTLSIFDIQGRLIRTLLSGSGEKGIHKATWDGRNSLGSPVADGVYLYRLQTDEFSRTGRVVLLR